MVTFVKPKFKFWNFPLRRDEIHSHQCQRKINQRNFHCIQIFILPCPSPNWKTWFSEGLQSKPPRIYFLSLKKSEEGLWASSPRDQYNHILQWRSLINKTAKKHLSCINAILGEGNGTPLQYSCLENPIDGGVWSAAVHGVAKSWTRLSDFTFTFHFHALEKEMAAHSSIHPWRIPGTGEPGALMSMGSHRVGHDWSDLAVAD